MSDQLQLWMRDETRQTEQRAPVTPGDARRLIERGVLVTVEQSSRRIFPIERYAAAGCRIVPSGAWVDAPADQVIVGLKELPPLPLELRHRHLYFGHAYKQQAGARELLTRFAAGGGALLDVEFLVDDAGRRVASFGHWAGYVGAALSVLRARGRLATPLRPYRKDAMDAALAPRPGDAPLRVLVVGAGGRCGRGARAALEAAGAAVTCWDIEETRVVNRAELLEHDVLVNTILATGPTTPFLTVDDLDDRARRLRLICDVTCDVTSPYNALPIYERTTQWPDPVVRLRGGEFPLDLIAIDNLPSLLPVEASEAFSAELTPHLLELDGDSSTLWRRCAEAFRDACRAAGIDRRLADV